MNRREVLTATAAVVVAAAAPAMTVEASAAEALERMVAGIAAAADKMAALNEAALAAWRVFRVSDYEWYVARNAYEALAAAARDWGCEEIPLDPAALLADLEAHSLADEMPMDIGDAGLDHYQFVDTDPNDEALDETRRPFREELRQRVAAGLSAPELFAATDW